MGIVSMSVNPYNSPVLRQLQQHQQFKENQRQKEFVKKHLTLLNLCKCFTQWYNFSDLADVQGCIRVNNEFYLSTNRKKGNRMRLISRLDWVHYTPSDLAHAIETGSVAQYYGQQLQDPASGPNIWSDTLEELVLKTYYAHRMGRNLDVLDNL